MKNIVIVGGGFGGLQAALNLEKKFSARDQVAITLVDRRDYHLFTPNLYEVASSEEELVSVSQIKKSITLPFKQVIKNKNIKLVRGQLKSINPDEKIIEVDQKNFAYDYLILALGSQSEFFNIEGAKKYAMTLKDLPDALRIRNQLEFAVQAHRMDANKKTLRVVVAGGGYTGLELVAELKGLMDFLAWKNQYPRHKIELEVIEAANKVIPGFDERLSDDAYERVMELGIRVRLSARIGKVDNGFVELMDGEKVAFDVLIWTVGVRACQINCGGKIEADPKGKILVNEFLQSQKYHNIFVVGDLACVKDGKGQPVPSSAQDALDQAKYLAYALPFVMINQKPSKVYIPKSHGFIVNLGGKWAVVCSPHLYLTGLFGFLVNQAAHLRYYASLVGWLNALRYIVFQEEMYSRNDD